MSDGMFIRDFLLIIAKRNGYGAPRPKMTPEERKERTRAVSRASSRKLRNELLDAYGHACACCGETEAAFLAIDHIHNDGAQHRRELGGGMSVAAWLRKNGYPKDRFQLLCHNCNMAKRFGPCPHKLRLLPPSADSTN